MNEDVIKKPNILCLILLISFASVAAVLISPALPAISDAFNVSNGYTQQLITVFIVGYAFGQLMYSPFANRYGRKPAIYIGVILYMLSSLLCLLGIYLHDLNMIIAGRFFMGLGSSCGMAITFTLINDSFDAAIARRVTSYVLLAFGLMPAVAIAIGGFITTHFTWVDCFVFYFFYGFIVLWVATKLPETLRCRELNALKPGIIFSMYKHAFTTSRVVLFSCIYGLMSSYIYIIASAAPFVGMDTIGLTASYYGILLLIPYFGQVAGALLAAQLNKHLTAYQVIAIGYGFVCLGSMFMLIAFLCHWVSVISLIAPILFIMIGLPMAYSGATVMALLGYIDKSTGSAVMSFLTMFVCLLVTLVLNSIPSHNPLIMPVLFTAVFIIAVIVFKYCVKRFGTQSSIE